MCVIIWLKGRHRAYQFLESHSLHTLSEQKLNGRFFPLPLNRK